MTPKQTYYKLQADTIIQNLKKRQIAGYYCVNKEDAVKTAMSFTKSGETISFGGSMTLVESGAIEALKARDDIRLIDRSLAKTPEEIKQAYRDSFSADTYFMSSNAITLDGQLVNIDGNGNRVAALIYGPNQVVILAGMNKIVPDVETGVQRVRNFATPPNCVRLNKQTPCAATGTCANCLSKDCICNQIVITRRSGTPDRIKVILIGEELGY